MTGAAAPPPGGAADGPQRFGRPAPGARIDASHARGVQIGDGGVQTNVFVTVGTPVRSAYLHQVRAIAPSELRDRKAELEELTAFCTDPVSPGYLWWRAPAWAGKSALMAWFALHPPAGTRVVSFFVTGRFAGHADRTGFTDVVLEQLADLLDRPLPAHLSEATRGAHLIALLTDAAALCEERGERLVLLVDGLDEDRGAASGPEVHSIAALLPATLPHGLRVVVASRPDPPPAADVPDDHPLRNGEVLVRELGMSPHAQVVRRDAERELKRLLHGSPAEQDLLGLVTASGGGLRAADLAELTGLDRWRVDELLGTVTARTFTRRRAAASGVVNAAEGAAPDAYLLAHEELQAAARRFLGAQLVAHRQRLCAWADAYRARGWPEDTPDYLLRGYTAMLADSGMARELTACATDGARHARLLARTGADAAALAEIGTAQDAALAQQPPDLSALGVLAVHHGLLAARNAALPTALPSAWAVLGDFARAEALAGATPEPRTRAALLTDLVERAARAGDRARAVRLADRTSATARGIVNTHLRGEASAALAGALAGAGLVDEATAVVGALTDEAQRRGAAGACVEALARTGQDARLRTLIAAVVRPEGREDAWRTVADVWGRQGRVEETERVASALTSRARAFALESVVGAQAAAGRYATAEATAATVPDPFLRERALKRVAVELARAGRFDRAEAIVDRIGEPMLRNAGLQQLAAVAADGLVRNTAGAEERARATRLWTRACAGVDALPDPSSRVREWTYLVEHAAPAGGPAEVGRLADRAEAAARTLRRSHAASFALSQLAKALARAGAYDRAEELMRTLSSYTAQETACDLIEVAVRQGLHVRAEALVRSGDSTVVRDRLLLAMVHALRAEGRLTEALAAARTLRSPRRRAEGLAGLALALAEAGERPEAAETAAEAERGARFLDGGEEARSLAALLRGLTVAGDRARAGVLAQRAGTADSRLAEEPSFTNALPELVEALYRAATLQPAGQLLREARPAVRAACLTALVGAAGRARRPAHVTAFAAKALAAARTDPSDSDSAAYQVSRLAQALYAAGSPRRAEALLAAVKHPAAQVRGWREMVITTPHEDHAQLHRIADLAEAAAAEATPSNALDEALLWLAEALVGAGLHHRAERLARPLLHPYARDVRTTVRMHVAAARGDLLETARLAGTMQSPGWRRRTMSLLAATAARAGDAGAARELLGVATQGVGPEEWHDFVGEVAVAMAACGDPDAALALAESVPIPAERALVLVDVARKLDPAQARPLLARALREGDWRPCVGALARKWPEAVAAMADAFVEATG
ncbi:hypothetical protein ACF09C_20625 [Streptomyces sp. NPDC014870]|uniref:hypothetical protein n=1 Tax=Streptomyces sp. NPDC014870 TaxID=3364925 RepID=UPI0036F6E762